MCIVELTEIVLFVYFHTSPVHRKDNLHTMDPFLGPNPPKECSHSTCHKIILSTEAGIKQYKTCEDCWGWDAAARKRKWQNAKAAGQATTQASEEVSTEAPTGMPEDRPSRQKWWRTLGLTFVLDSSDDKHDSVRIGDWQLCLLFRITWMHWSSKLHKWAQVGPSLLIKPPPQLPYLIYPCTWYPEFIFIFYNSWTKAHWYLDT